MTPVDGGDGPAKVLLVDDDRDALLLLQHVLGDGHAVQTAADGEQAWQLLTTDPVPPDLVICDLGMPRVGGDELVVRMRGDVALRRVPVILLTGRDSPQSRLEMLDAGVADYLLKPFRPEELRLRVRNILRDNMLLHQVQEARRAADAANRELLEVNLELDRFAAAAAHDLQAPLANIAAYADMLARGTIPDVDKQSSVLRAIGDNAERAHTLVRDLLQHARTVTSIDDVTVVDLDEVLDAVARDLQRVMQEHGATLVRPEPLGHVRGRRVAVESVLLNLLSNALKYRVEGRAPVITVSTTPTDDGQVALTVVDNGRGVAEADRDRVLDLGVQGRDPEPGTGIGLATVRAVVNRHGGVIELSESPAPGGLTVRITLPGS